MLLVGVSHGISPSSSSSHLHSQYNTNSSAITLLNLQPEIKSIPYAFPSYSFFNSPNMTMTMTTTTTTTTITSLFAQYELLTQTSKYLSTLDLVHLFSASSDLYALIRQNEQVWHRLKHEALCDGHGLKARQDFRRLYALAEPHDFIFGSGRKAHYDEELEVRVWNRKCDAVNALPCLKCGVNVCEECRYMPRVRDLPGWKACRRPHFDPAWESHTIICYCKNCDEMLDRELPLSLNEFCDCDQYTRWICLSCKEIENREDEEYYSTRTQLENDINPSSEEDEGRRLGDHSGIRAFWCPCGTRAPKNGNVRCAWCRRKHNLETWKQGDPDEIPFFDNDPCYPQMRWN